MARRIRKLLRCGFELPDLASTDSGNANDPSSTKNLQVRLDLRSRRKGALRTLN